MTKLTKKAETVKRKVYLQQELFLFGIENLEDMGIKVVLDDYNRIIDYTVNNPDIEVICGTY